MIRSFALLVALVLASGSTAGALAQSNTLPLVGPAACVIAPISIPPPGEDGDLNAATPVPTPIATEPSQPADTEAAAAIIERIAQSIACQNAGDLPRMLANFSPGWLLERFSGYDRVFLQRFLEQAASPKPLAEEDRIELVAVDDIGVRGDGAATTVVTTRQGGVERRSLLALVFDGDTWLIDSGQPLVSD